MSTPNKSSTPAEKSRPASSSLVLIEAKSETDGRYIRHVKFGSPEYDVQPINPEESYFRHSPWADQRSKVWQAFKAMSVSDARLSRFANCGSGLWLEASEDGQEMRIACNKCRDRWCVPCQAERAAKIRASLMRMLDGRYYRKIVLTMRASDTPLKDQLDRLYHSFNKLRERESWKEHITGGVAFVELKIGERSGLWHPHLHIIAEGEYWDSKQLSEDWHAVTGDSFITWIEAPHNLETDTKYHTKYVTKPADQRVFANKDMLEEMIIALRGRRLATTFGSWRGVRLDDDIHEPVTFKSVGSLTDLKRKANEGDEEARHWIIRACHRWPELTPWLQSRPAPKATGPPSVKDRVRRDIDALL